MGVRGHMKNNRKKKRKNSKLNDVFDVTINVRLKPARHHIGARAKTKEEQKKRTEEVVYSEMKYVN